ncbi:MAG: class IIb bacteriocin, lactobin A/cerein 7B family [Bacteroidales bacterium]|nr:class IIb bacteriocin, lactobin A/cerein 7B family [Bacteroidales bacterium]
METLKNYGVLEMNTEELINIDGGRLTFAEIGAIIAAGVVVLGTIILSWYYAQ